jgi:mannosyltransferase
VIAPQIKRQFAMTWLRATPRSTAPGPHEDVSPFGWSRAEIAFVTVLTSFVVIAGAWMLDAPSLWNDEAATWAISGHSLSDLLGELTASAGDRGAALYYVVIHLWMEMFGTSEVALRSLSVVAAAATILPLYAVGRRLVGRAAAATGTALLAVSPVFLSYAREARTYALATFLVVMATWAFVCAVESERRRDWVVYGILASVAVYAHWFAALIVLAHLVSLLTTRLERGAAREAARGFILFAVLTSPVALLVLFGGDTGIEWIAPLSGKELETFISNLLGTSSRVEQLVVFGLLVVGVLAVIEASRRARRIQPTRVPALVPLWFALPIVGVIAISAFKPVLIARYMIVVLPAMALLLGAGLTRLSRARLLPTVAGAAILVLLASQSYSGVWNGAHNEDWRALSQTISGSVGTADVVMVFPASAVFPLAYYARDERGLRRRPGPQWPPMKWDTPFNRKTANSSVLGAESHVHSPNVWLVVRAPGGSTVRQDVIGKPILDALERRLARRYAQQERVTASKRKGIYVIHYWDPIAP